MKIYKDGQIKRIKINKVKGKKYRKWGNHNTKTVVPNKKQIAAVSCF